MYDVLSVNVMGYLAPAHCVAVLMATCMEAACAYDWEVIRESTIVPPFTVAHGEVVFVSKPGLDSRFVLALVVMLNKVSLLLF